jgi:hypothetical protein
MLLLERPPAVPEIAVENAAGVADCLGQPFPNAYPCQQSEYAQIQRGVHHAHDIEFDELYEHIPVLAHMHYTP